MSNSLIEEFRKAGQPQVFAFYDQLNDAQKAQLIQQAHEIDLSELAQLNRTLVAGEGGQTFDYSTLTPAPFEPLPAHGGDANKWQNARQIGEDALRAGRVAAFTVAGGQGTRLGYDGPKGTFPVTPIRNHTLFQVFAEKLLAAGARYGAPLHWFVMTSEQNHVATEAFFRQHDFFGLNENQVHLFQQGRMPAVDHDGKILLSAPDEIVLSANGHGGSLRALERSGSLDAMERAGVDVISYFQVDNPLVHVIDAAFIGFHVQAQSEMSSRALPKAYPNEKIGHFCSDGDRLTVVEYSDLPTSMQEERDENGNLRFVAGSIAIHLLDREFVRRMASGEGQLPFHRADKKISTIDENGDPIKPDKPNGIKFELFVFDALPFARNPIVIETSRESEFSPVKNAEGVDSPQTCRDDQVRQFARWAIEAGADISVEETGLPAFAFEVSPLFATDEASFAESWGAVGAKADDCTGHGVIANMKCLIRKLSNARRGLRPFPIRREEKLQLEEGASPAKFHFSPLCA